MYMSDASEPELVKSLLEPLLEDFQYWFQRSQTLLETETIEFLGADGQQKLLERVKQAQREVSTIQMLMIATESKVGIETAILMPWHNLVTECWKVAIRFRLDHAQNQAE